MSLTIEFSKDTQAALEAQARAAQMAPERYAAHIVDRAVENARQQAARRLESQLDAMAAQVLPAATP